MSIEVEYRLTPDDDDEDLAVNWTRWSGSAADDATSIVVDGLDLGKRYDIRARYVAGDTYSEWTTQRSVLIEKDSGVPPAVDQVRLTKNDCVTWEMAGEVLDLRGYRVRHAPGIHADWGTAESAHEDLVAAPPFILCRTPKGRRSILVKAVDWDDNESISPTIIHTFRGDLDDAGEFSVRVEEQAGVVTDAVSPADSTAPFWLSSLEPVWSSATNVPFWTDDSAPAWDRLWGEATPAWGPDETADRWATPYRWKESVWTITVGSCEDGPRAVLSIDVVATGAFRLSYRKRYQVAAWAQEGATPYWTDDGDAAWADPTEAFRPWPGRLQPLEPGEYQIRVLLPGGLDQREITTAHIRISSEARTLYVSSLSIPSNGGTRAPLPDEWRRLVHVEAIPMTADPRSVPVGHKSPVSGPALRLYDAEGDQAAGVVDVLVRGY